MNDFIKNKFKWKQHDTKPKKWYKDSDYFKLQEAANAVPEVISRCKEEYQNHLALKCGDLVTNAKMNWLFLNTFYNGKKVPIIQPLLIDNKVISDFEVKANHSNNFFSLNVHL